MRKTERRSHRGCWVRMEIFVNIPIVKSWRVLRRNLKQLIRARVRWLGREDGGELDERVNDRDREVGGGERQKRAVAEVAHFISSASQRGLRSNARSKEKAKYETLRAIDHLEMAGFSV